MMERMNNPSAGRVRMTATVVALIITLGIIPCRLTAREPRDLPNDTAKPPAALPPAPAPNANDPRPQFKFEVTIGETDADGNETILASPSLITSAGQPAYFNIGGETPILFPNNGRMPIASMPIGTNLRFLAGEVSDGRILMDVKAQESEDMRKPHEKRILHQTSRAIRTIEIVELGETVAVTLPEASDGDKHLWAHFRVLREPLRTPTIEQITVEYALYHAKAADVATKFVARTRHGANFKLGDEEGTAALTVKPVTKGNRLVVTMRSNLIDDVSELIRQLDVNE